jgi:arylsulfatase A-like enzyme
MRLISFFSLKWRDKIFHTDGERRAEEVNADAINWLAQHKEEPFFLFLNYFDAHDPYTLGQRYRGLFTKEKRPYDEINDMIFTISNVGQLRFTDIKVAEDTKAYLNALHDMEIRYLDHYVGLLLTELRRMEVLDDSIVIITSDHGEEFFDHGGILHMQTLYQEMLHVPLMIHYPESFSGKRVSERVGIIDLYRTILDLLDIEVPAESGLDSVSLRPLIEGTGKLNRGPVIAERYNREPPTESQQAAIITDKWKLIEVEPERGRLVNSLFDLENDPEEKENLYQLLPEKRKQLQKKLRSQTDTNKSGLIPLDSR